MLKISRNKLVMESWSCSCTDHPDNFGSSLMSQGFLFVCFWFFFVVVVCLFFCCCCFGGCLFCGGFWVLFFFCLFFVSFLSFLRQLL